MRKVIAAVVVLVLVVAGAWAIWRGRGSGAAPAAAPQEGLPPVQAPTEVTAEGRVVPVRSAQLSFATAGVVAEVLVKDHDRVEAGQVLARLVSTRQQAALEQARAEVRRLEAQLAELLAGARPQELEAAEAAVASAQAALDRLLEGASPAELAAAEAEVARARAQLGTLTARPDAPAEEVEAARAAVKAAEARLEQLRRGPSPAEIAQAQAQVRSSQAQLELRAAGPRPEAVAAMEAALAAARAQVAMAEAALAETELRAPFAGTVGAVEIKPGQYATPGTPVVWLADLSEWEIETEDLTELKVAGITVGTRARLSFDAIPDLELTGTVVRIRPLGERQQGDIVYRVVVRPDRPDDRLRWNMTAAITFELEQKE